MSQLSSKIIGGEDSSEAEALYTASLQVNEVHICCAGMFKPGFLISSGQCVAEIKNELKNISRRGSAVLGDKYLEKGKRCDILGLKLHPYFDTLKQISNFDVGVVMVRILTIFNFLINVFIIHRFQIYQNFFFCQFMSMKNGILS